jgi:hypothetical protein
MFKRPFPKNALVSAGLLRLLFLLLALAVGGCSDPRITVAPVAFTHSDEIRTGEGFTALADRRIFVTMAFLNATGFDDEEPGVPLHPVRQKVRQRVAETLSAHPEKLREWRQYVKSKNLGSFVYQNFALSLETDYPFQRIRPDNELNYPATVRQLAAFPDRLRDFWLTTDLTNVWNEVKADYLSELKQYDFAAMQRQMDSLWKYLRLPRHDTMSIVNVPDLLDQHEQALAAH